jgi:hypothetical protein
MDSYVRTFDTTLRDGEQSPGASLTSAVRNPAEGIPRSPIYGGLAWHETV